MENLEPEDKKALLNRAEESVAANVIPAYNKLATYIESLRGKALRNDGVWALPDGEKFYDYQIEWMTTTKMGARELHDLGVSEVARRLAMKGELRTGARWGRASHG